jgi:hypothetical protein
VFRGEAIGLGTAAGAAGAMFARPLRPTRAIRFELQWRAEVPSPALGEFIRAAQAHTQPDARLHLLAA